MNLLGHVDIKTCEQALEFVRFFSTSKAGEYLRPDGLVEVFRGKGDTPFDIEPIAFDRLFVRPAARQSKAEGEDCAGCVTQFFLKRTMASPDRRVFEVSELVTEDGYYQELSRRELLRDGRKVGIVFFSR